MTETARHSFTGTWRDACRIMFRSLALNPADFRECPWRTHVSKTWRGSISRKCEATARSGPYMLGGLCAGGVIAYEMASQLKSTGETVQTRRAVRCGQAASAQACRTNFKAESRRLEAVFAGVRGNKG